MLFAQGIEVSQVTTVGPKFVGGPGQVEALSAQFLGWEAEMLESTSVLQRYGSLELVFVAWEYAMTHTLGCSQTFCVTSS